MTEQRVARQPQGSGRITELPGNERRERLINTVVGRMTGTSVQGLAGAASVHCRRYSCERGAAQLSALPGDLVCVETGEGGRRRVETRGGGQSALGWKE